MASEKEDTDIDNSLSTWQKIKSGFAGDTNAQMAQKRAYMRQNDEEAQLEAIRKRKAQTEPQTGQEP